MKKIILFLFTVHCSLFTVFSQSPQKFNYQAVVRDNTGDLVTNQAVGFRISLLQESTTGAAVYVETHNVTTDPFGLVTLEIGNGTMVSGDFSSIVWNADSYFLKVEMDAAGGTSYADFGTSQLLSVPYAMVAKYAESSSTSTETSWIDGPGKVTTTVDVGVGTSTPASKLEVQGDPGTLDTVALFEVTRSDGRPVFSVYPGGVRINVDDPPPGKGTKGGFAVGGFSALKGLTNDYLYVTPDSVRVYVDTTLTKGTKGGFAVGGFNPGKGTSSSLMHLTEDNYLIGHQAGNSITTGLYNSFLGYYAGFNNTEGNSNVFIGHESGWSNTVGEYNVFMGLSAGETNEDGNSNIFLGAGSGYDNVSGSENVFIGLATGSCNTGNNNTFVGSYAGENNVSGENNVFIGYGAGQDEMGSGKLHINNNNISSEPLVYGEFSATDPYFNINAFTDVVGDMGVEGNMDVTGDITGTNITGGTITEVSDKRLKTDIKGYQDALAQVSKLQGVTFNWIKDDSRELNPEEYQIGLIAQEVEEIIPQLVKTNKDGFKSVSYSKLTVVLLEALKEQQKMIEEMQRQIDELKRNH